MSKVTALYHIVFSTSRRAMVINNEFKEHLYRYIWRVIEDHSSRLIRIGGTPNHIHMLIDLSAKAALGSLMQKLKSGSSKWMKNSGYFPSFDRWSSGYFAATLAWENKAGIIDYINAQQEHHKLTTFDKELTTLAVENGLVLYEDDFA